jgi:FkbM family methyltransferase
MKIGSVEIQLFDKKDSYNDAANNERMIELPLAEWFLKKHNYLESMIEVGAVTPYYFGKDHLVFDPFDKYEKCVRIKAEEIDYANKILLSISTVEHICKKYNSGPIDWEDDLALKVLLKMMKAKEYLITFPRRFNKSIDDFVEQEKEHIIKLKRIESHVWQKVESLVDVGFNHPFSCGNGLYIVTNCKELLESDFMFESIKSQHESVYNEIIVQNQYRVSKEDLEEKNILDIGANNGIFTLLAKSYNANKIIAVESNIDVFNLLKSNVKESSDISIINKAVTGKSGNKVSVIKRPEFCNIDGRCYIMPDEKGDIETISLDDLIKKFDDKQIVLKLDVEGSEYDIIYGASLEFLKKCSTILIEMHDDMGAVSGKIGLIEKLRNNLKEIGFKETWIYDYVKNVKIARYDFMVEVTVVISEYLRPELLLRQIECFQKQTLKPKEIIVWQTQVEGQEEAYKLEHSYSNVYIVKTNHDFKLPARFVIPLLAKTPYVCLVDDDVFPGPKWLEECNRIFMKDNVVVSPYGIKYKKETQHDMNSDQYGDNGKHNELPVKVDIGGHGWFCPTRFFLCFGMESCLDERRGDDIHFAYCLKKYLNIDIMVSPYPENNKDIWGNLDSEAGMGVKSLHARKFEDEKIWKNLDRKGWESSELQYLKNNLNDFCCKREEIVKKYIKSGWLL